MTDIKGIKTSDGVEHKIDYESLANRLQFQFLDTTIEFRLTLEPKVVTTIDFSSVIPEDGHAYLAAVRAAVNTEASGFVSLYGTTDPSEDANLYRYCWARFSSTTKAQQTGGSTCVIAFPPDSRLIKLYNSGSIATSLCVLAPCWSMKLA